MSGIIIFNTAPIQYIHQLGLFHLVQRLFGKICVPEEVLDEIDQGKQDGIELPDLRQLDYVEIVPAKEGYVSQIVRDLGKGETAVILRDLETPDSLVVLDDLLARRVARGLGVRLTGTAGILINAKMQGFIKAVEPYLIQSEQLGFYLSQKHRALILQKAGEP